MQVAPAWPAPALARVANPRNGAASRAGARAGEFGLPTPAARRGSGRSRVGPSKLLRNPHAMTGGNADRHLELGRETKSVGPAPILVGRAISTRPDDRCAA